MTGADHPQLILADALAERAPVSEQTRRRYRERMGRALLLEVAEAMDLFGTAEPGTGPDTDVEQFMPGDPIGWMGDAADE